MSNNSQITILTCQAAKKAVKEFFAKQDGTIEKRSYSAGTFFKHETKPVTCFSDMVTVLEGLLDKPNKCVIRGSAKPSAGEVVRRKVNEPGAAFDPCPRPYVMLDFDKYPCPEHFDLVNNPEEGIEWLIATIHPAYSKASCYWQLSASQNVPAKVGEKPEQTISAHLWFYFDRDISDKELKYFFKANSTNVDLVLFSAVQIHYTAGPIFHGFGNPTPIRSGVIKRDCDVVILPEIIVPEEKTSKPRAEHEPVVTLENWNKAIESLLPYYKPGVRDRMGGAIASVLYRYGWTAVNVANFVYELADAADDEEANNRYKSALRACDSVDKNRPVPGIPVLKDEIGITNIDEILLLLGLSNDHDLEIEISKLNKESSFETIEEVLAKVIKLPKGKQTLYLNRIKGKTGYNIGSLREMLKEVEDKEITHLKSEDIPFGIIVSYVDNNYANGQHLLHSSDGNYWNYNGTHWQVIAKKKIEGELLFEINDVLAVKNQTGVASILKQCMQMLPGFLDSYRAVDPFAPNNQNIPSVINCLNGEVWVDKKGKVSFLPHRPDSYLRHCLNVEYNHNAKSPMFDNAVLDIFSNSTDPQGMLLHFMELAGYLCQPSREFPIIVLLYGGGSNGKTSLMKIIMRIMGSNAFKSCRLGDIEKKSSNIAGLAGKLMVIDDDVDSGTVIPDGFVKKISEEKEMTADHKFKDEFNFICRAVPVMLANDFPATKDLTYGIRRRLIVIPFNRTFLPNEIKVDLFNEIWEQESPGVLNHIISGLQSLKKRGGFQELSDCNEAREEWIKRANTLTNFIADCCEKAEGNNLPVRMLYEGYKAYCKEEGINQKFHKRNFKNRFVDLGYRISRIHGEVYVWGLKLVEDKTSLWEEPAKPDL